MTTTARLARHDTAGIAAAAPYFLGSGDVERARLLRQSQIHAEATRRLLDDIGVGPGWSAIDVGCGPIGILPELAARVGPRGSVVGLDNEPRMLQMAQRTLDERALANVSLHEAPAHTSGLQRAIFDLAHARLLLINVAQPEEVLAEMVALTKPGGVVALQDVDWISWACEPPHPAWDRLVQATAQARAAVGLDIHIGRRLPAMLSRAGLVDIQVHAEVYLWRRGDPPHALLLHFADLHRSGIVAHGGLSSEEVDALVAELREHLDRDDALSIYALYFQAWGRKPL